MDIAVSVNGVPIRLTEERWTHIVNNHDEMAGYYDDCLRVLEEPDLLSPALKKILFLFSDASQKRREAPTLLRSVAKHCLF